MALSGYEIGLTVGTLTPVEDIGSGPNLHPRSHFEPWTEIITTINSRTYGDGFPATTWEFAYMPRALWNHYLNFFDGQNSVELFIRTRIEDGTFALFAAVMHMPEKAQEFLGWRDMQIRFTRLELQEEEEPE